jgi:hypothetical protein
MTHRSFTLFSIFRCCICLTLIISESNAFSQIINLHIEDSVIVKKPNEDAVRVTLTIATTIKDVDTLVLYKINKYVPSNPFILEESDIEKYSSELIYVVERMDGSIVAANDQTTPSFKRARDEIEFSERVYIVTSKLKIQFVHRGDISEDELSRVEIIRGEKTIEVFPLLKKYHSLSKGTYYLFFCYAINGQRINLCDKSTAANVISNKVKLEVN